MDQRKLVPRAKKRIDKGVRKKRKLKKKSNLPVDLRDLEFLEKEYDLPR